MELVKLSNLLAKSSHRLNVYPSVGLPLRKNPHRDSTDVIQIGGKWDGEKRRRRREGGGFSFRWFDQSMHRWWYFFRHTHTHTHTHRDTHTEEIIRFDRRPYLLQRWNERPQSNSARNYFLVCVSLGFSFPLLPPLSLFGPDIEGTIAQLHSVVPCCRISPHPKRSIQSIKRSSSKKKKEIEKRK